MTRDILIRRGLWGLACAALLAGAGCVERKITIVSDPPGALTYVNDVEVGRTPLTIPFLWYGDYDVRLRAQTEKAGKTQDYYLHTHRVASAPPFQWLGVDLFAEIWPTKFVDHKIWAFDVPPVPTPTQEQLLENANALRDRLNAPTALPAPHPAAAAATQPTH